MLATLREMLERQPFVPFQIVMSSGDRVRIEHPELVAIGKDQVIYCFPRSNSLAYLRLSQVVMYQVDELQA